MVGVKNIGRKTFIISVLLLILILLPTIKSEAAWSSRPKQLNNSWTKCGSYYLKKQHKDILCKKGSKITTIRTPVGIAYYDNGYVLFSELFDDGYAGIYLYSLKERRQKCVVPPKNGLCLFGFYKGYVYYSTININESVRYTERIKIKGWGSGTFFADLSDDVRIYSLDNIGGVYQYKNYLIALGLRYDPAPTVLKIYDLSSQKCSLIAKNCTTARVINGTLYYSLISGYQKDRWGMYKNFKHTIYKSSISGKGKKKLAQFIGSDFPPLLEKTCAYFFNSGDFTKNMYKYTYSQKKKSKTSMGYSSFFSKYYHGKGYVVSAG